MTQPDDDRPAARAPAGCRPNIVERSLAGLIRYWALLGGIVTLGLAVMTAFSAASNVLFEKPFAADYELVKNGIGVAVFMFLPYCQLTGSNVSVDVFTENMSERKKAAMMGFSALFAVAFSGLLLRQMTLGMFSYMRYPEVTPVLKLPLWSAFPPILVSLTLLLVAAIITAVNAWRGIRGVSMADHAAGGGSGE